MAVWRDAIFRDREVARIARVVEPELDMDRMRLRRFGLWRVLELLHWLTPEGRQAVRPPRRAVGREIEEEWPAAER